MHPIDGRIKMDNDMVYSQAFKDISSCNAIRVLYMCICKSQNVGEEFKFTYTEARDIFGIYSSATFSKIKKQLVERLGFLDVVRQGGPRRTATIFRLSNRWRKYGTPEYDRRTIPHNPLTKHGFKKKIERVKI